MRHPARVQELVRVLKCKAHAALYLNVGALFLRLMRTSLDIIFQHRATDHHKWAIPVRLPALRDLLQRLELDQRILDRSSKLLLDVVAVRLSRNNNVLHRVHGLHGV